jgi:hypothetical protein
VRELVASTIAATATAPDVDTAIVLAVAADRSLYRITCSATAAAVERLQDVA